MTAKKQFAGEVPTVKYCPCGAECDSVYPRVRSWVTKGVTVTKVYNQYVHRACRNIYQNERYHMANKNAKHYILRR